MLLHIFTGSTKESNLKRVASNNSRIFDIVGSTQWLRFYFNFDKKTISGIYNKIQKTSKFIY